jgi:hypothetical protein
MDPSAVTNGEGCGGRDLLLRTPFLTGYGVEIATPAVPRTREVRVVFRDTTPSGGFAAIDVGTPPLSYRKG